MADYGDYEPLNDRIDEGDEVENSMMPNPPPSPSPPPSSSNASSSTPKSKSMLMPRSSAPIHITISSFGYLYGCPSSKSVTPSDPLPAFDCRNITEASKGVERLSGFSAVVRREVRQGRSDIESNTMMIEAIQWRKG